MTKRIDPDLLALKRMNKAIQNCSCKRMVKANLVYLWDKYVINSNKLPSELRKLQDGD